MSEQNRTAPHRTTLNEVRDLVAVPIFSPTAPNAAGVLGVSRWTAYNLVRAGTLETIELSANRRVVPVHGLLKLLGETRTSWTDVSSPSPTPDPGERWAESCE